MPVPEPNSFGELVRQHRRALGLTQEALAERAGVSPRGIRALEAGERRSPQRETVRLLADALGLQGDERRRFEAAVGPAIESPVTEAEAVSRLSLRSCLNNLPDEPTRFVGREREIGHVADLLGDPHVRLLTLTGPGGTGKTRLAIETARVLLDDFPAGVYFVNLAPLADSALVPSVIAEVLDIREGAGRTVVDSLAMGLAEKRLLLVLDNLEHLLGATPVVARLLDDCPELRVLATSRIPLNLRREHRFAVPPLAVPDPVHRHSPGMLPAYEAVALFIERARAVNDSFGLTTENAADVAAICVELDGLPLAIELAAARIRLFPPHALRQRLSGRLSLLTGGARDLPDRQRSLRGAIDWSYSLLEPGEQALFARLSVFAGGWTLGAAEQVCNPDGDLPIDLVDGIAALVENSLVQQVGETEPRLEMLETIREYAGEALAGRQEREAVYAAHASTFLRLADEAERELAGPEQAAWLSQLETELGNIRQALRTFLDRGEVERELRLAAALHRFWDIRGYWSEGRRWLEVGLSAGAGAPADARAHALITLGTLEFRQGELDRATMVVEESVALLRAADDRSGTARALRILGTIVGERGRREEAVGILEESLTLSRELGDRMNCVAALGSLGRLTAQMGDLVTSLAWFEQTLQLAREIGDLRPLAITLLNMGDLESQLGRLAHAEARLDEARALAEELGDSYTLSHALETLAGVQRERGRAEEARANLRESMRMASELGGLSLILILLGEFAGQAIAEGDPTRAARLEGAEEALRERLGIPRSAEDQSARAATHRQVRAMLDEHALSLARGLGAGMSLEEAVAYALGESTEAGKGRRHADAGGSLRD